MKNVFPKDFIFGVASSAHQIEGSPLSDNAGKSIWYTFCHTPGNINDNSTIDIACDHYNRWKEDIKLLKYLGVSAYRFSISWPRVLPNGYGRVNIKGLDFYNRIIDELLKNEILPVVTIHHWELPVNLQYYGGWLNNKIVDWFTEYSYVLFKTYADKVKFWITLNEPIVTVSLGYLFGIYPPTMRDTHFAFKTAYNLALAHGKTVKLFKEMNIKNAKIGIALNCMPIHPLTKNKLDIEAAKKLHSFQNELFLDILFFGNYPQILVDLFKENIVPISYEDKKIITSSIDFVGLNYYTRFVVKYTDKNVFLNCEYVKDKNKKYTTMGWEVYPKGLYELISWINKKYQPKMIIITENGASFNDKINKSDNKIYDYDRIEFLKEHIKYLYQALKKYNNIKGYFVWSFLDNFEWTEGYRKRFGLIYVDYKTQKRIIKESGFWYKNFLNKKTV
jgi:beta-glucosidase